MESQVEKEDQNVQAFGEEPTIGSKEENPDSGISITVADEEQVNRDSEGEDLVFEHGQPRAKMTPTVAGKKLPVPKREKDKDKDKEDKHKDKGDKNKDKETTPPTPEPARNPEPEPAHAPPKPVKE